MATRMKLTTTIQRIRQIVTTKPPKSVEMRSNYWLVTILKRGLASELVRVRVLVARETPDFLRITPSILSGGETYTSGATCKAAATRRNFKYDILHQWQQKKQVRFQLKDDLVLLREVLARNPFKNKSAWNEIALSVADTRYNFQVDARRVRESSHLLIDQHKKTNAESLKSSGIDEEYGKKETLLDEILSLVEDEEKQKEKEKEKKEKEENRGKDIRKRAMENLTPKKSDDESNDATPSKRNSSGNIVGYLKKNEAEMVYRRQEFEVTNSNCNWRRINSNQRNKKEFKKMENDN
ncbi:unnamed protein product [Mytilus coruscus]|uniref:Uncharacterized protein n=1 Tax=Mytilus coruscus TaxID=42192 RepID=A0A6J8AZ46_MYTCO|nr:unnamed protein product [Mytilus coruscus]